MGSTITKFGHLRIPLEDVLEATDNFDEKNVISHGELGKVFKGKLLRSGKWVNIAARRLDSKHKPGIEFLREISLLSRLKHENIVSIIGFCDENGEKVIINKYEAEGSLEMHLSKPSLTWIQRLKICIGVGRALSYIDYEDRRSYSLIHRNINSSTILLDDNFEPKLSGFEYSIRCSDIYSFGVVLWEIIYERKAFIPDEFDRFLVPLAEFRFENNQGDGIPRFLNDEIGRSSLITFMRSAYLCTNDKRAERPEMNFIVNLLEKALEFQLQYESLYRPNLERLTSQLSHMKIRLRDIRLATDHFSWTYYRLPTRFYDVYRAEPEHWDKRNSSSVEKRNKSERLEIRTTVFIKRLRPTKDTLRERVFGTDIEMLTTCKHPNIVTLLGFCDEDPDKILVIEAASNGLVSEYFLSHLHRDKSVLTWEKRLKICLDVAYALKYLHHEMEDQKSVIICHFTSSSISLDENFLAKIVYLGSSMFLPPNQKFVQFNSFSGSIFYTDPQYHEEGKLTRESDVYTFGVILFEILCGRLACDEMYTKESEAGLVDVARRCFLKGTLMEIIDLSIITEAKKDSIDTFVEIAYRCVAETQDQRPDMKSIINKLEKALELQLRNMEPAISNYSHLKIPLEDVLTATENFDEKNVISHGELGKVYQGKLLRSGKWVKIAARRFDRKHKHGIEFLTEISALSSLKHENIVSLIGFCDDKGEKVIINEYLAKGSLSLHLSKPTLTWVQRFKICVGVARALSYIHYEDGRSYSVIHCNINSSTILLNNKFEPKLSGFEFSIHRSVDEMDEVLITEAIGTTGYVDPTIHKTGGVTYKSDIYAFGVVLFEILFMREAFIPDEFDRFLAPLARFVYENNIVYAIQPFRNYEIGWMSLSNFLRAAYICSHDEGAQRPDMKSIVIDLEKVLEFQLLHEKFYRPNLGRLTSKLSHMKIRLADISLATDNFSRTYLYHSTDLYELYRAELEVWDKKNYASVKKKNNIECSKRSTTVIIKRLLPREDIEGEGVFGRNVEMLTTCKHRNIGTLLGFCDEDNEKILVVEDASNGYLLEYLANSRDKSVLTWEKRLEICLDVAYALKYLHHEMEDKKSVLICKFSSLSISLNENFGAKIVDLGSSIFLPPNQKFHQVSSFCGLKFYIDPIIGETCKVTRETDVHIFGVILFEILCGRVAWDEMYMKESEVGLVDVVRRCYLKRTLMEIIDPSIIKEANKDSIDTFVEIAYQCVAENPDERPDMKSIVNKLEKALELQLRNMASSMTRFSDLQIPLEDVLESTNNFDEKNVIGRGWLGEVYKGKLLRSGKSVKIAARRLDSKHKRGIHFLTEISVLSSLKHENIVSIIGFCDERGEKVIINKLEAKASLEIHLTKPRLTWVQRLKICIGVARALSYIHYEDGRSYSLIHRNINSSTILLNNKFEPKLSGFEFCINRSVYQMDEVLITKAIGTTGYVDPTIEKSGGVTYKSDIYSFGVVLWEILYMRKAFLPDEFDRFLAPFARFHYENKTEEMIQPFYNKGIGHTSLFTFQEAAYSCTNDERAQRPDMKSIIYKLEKALELQLQYERHYRPNLERLTSELSHMKIRLADISLATDNFSTKYFYHSTNFYDMYRAELEDWDKKNSASVEQKNKSERPKRCTTVFIKRLHPTEDKREEEELFSTEIEMLTTCKHHNVVTLLGFCDEDPEKILIIEDASNGYLIEYLANRKDKSVLTWEKRLKICLDVAYGLKYLHHEMEDQKTVIIRDFSTISIALDENLGAKLVDFGHSMFLPPNQDSLKFNSFFGTPFYMDPKYEKTGKLRRKSDVYTLGVILLEILCGRLAYDEMYVNENKGGLVDVARRCYLKGTLMEIIDPSIIKEATDDNNLVITKGPNKNSIDTFADIAYRCVNEYQNKRPTMEVVVKELEKALEQTQCQEHSDQVVDGFELMHENLTNLFEHLRIRLSDIMLATNNFSEEYDTKHDRNCHYYRAELEHFDQEKFGFVEEKNRSELPKKRSTVLIKRLHGEYKDGKKLLYNEIEMLTTCKHPNIVTLVGFCDEDLEMILVFEIPIYERLRELLLNEEKSIRLTWSKRLRICLDIAYGLKYLHYEKEDQKMISHSGNMSTALGMSITVGNMSLSVVVDENFRAKICDFSYSKFLRPNRNDFYFDLDFLSKTCNDSLGVDNSDRETDVYCFGGLLFEISCGKFGVDKLPIMSDEVEPAPVARKCFYNGILKEMIDPLIMEERCDNNFSLFSGPDENSLDAFMKIAVACTVSTPDERPTMKVVVAELEKALAYQENHKDPLWISLEDVQLATETFHEKYCVGQGGFGKVYKGKLPQGDYTVVAKLLDISGGQGEKQFLNELQILSEYKHNNIIGLVGYCAENDAKIIVYEYASRGSLDRYLNDTRLTWMTRLNICIDVATALDFLHRGVGKQATVIHRDIKTDNILLNDEWNAKLADFGLSLISPIGKETDYVIDCACGTEGYVDPLYLKSHFLTKESDIYSFGVVLFEILYGKSTFMIWKREGVYLPVFIKEKFEKGLQDDIVFEDIKAQINPESLNVFQMIAYRCLNEKREERPKAKDVLEQLKEAMELQMSRGNGASSSTADISNFLARLKVE